MTLKGFLKLLLVVVLVCAAWIYSPWKAIRHPPGILVNEVPKQEAIPQKNLPPVEGWSVSALARYEIKARVLGTKSYRGDANAKLVPVDVALGWKRMSDQAVLDQFDISMANRFYYYEWSDAPAIPETEIVASSANNHIIPADSTVRKAIGSLRTGQVVKMKGYLVNAILPGMGTWNSSLRREDSGNGACELFYVESVVAADAP